MEIAIAFLTTDVKRPTVTFAHQVALKTQFDVYIVPDNETTTISNSMVRIHHIDDSNCASKGYVNATHGTHIQKTPTAIDKFLYLFCELKTKYDFVWLIEDDVFIPSVSALISMVVSNQDHDFITSKHSRKHDTNLDWNWKHIVGKIDKPWFQTMACAAGFSRKMLNKISEYVVKNKTLFNSEVMFGTLAHHSNLSVYCPETLRTIMWQADWSIDDVMTLPNNFFHPIKDLHRHEQIRTIIKQAAEYGYQPVNKLPRFLNTKSHE